MKKCNGTSLLGWRELLSDSEFGKRKSLSYWIDINGSFVYKKKVSILGEFVEEQ
jgi:hypothetical protein